MKKIGIEIQKCQVKNYKPVNFTKYKKKDKDKQKKTFELDFKNNWDTMKR